MQVRFLSPAPTCPCGGKGDALCLNLSDACREGATPSKGTIPSSFRATTSATRGTHVFSITARAEIAPNLSSFLVSPSIVRGLSVTVRTQKLKVLFFVTVSLMMKFQRDWFSSPLSALATFASMTAMKYQLFFDNFSLARNHLVGPVA